VAQVFCYFCKILFQFFDLEPNEGVYELVFFFEELVVEGKGSPLEMFEVFLADLHFPAEPEVLDLVELHGNFWVLTAAVAARELAIEVIQVISLELFLEVLDLLDALDNSNFILD
jgi:hypothetical protein